ncbi:TPA: DUF3310 domain-containing protein [Streptococcus pneumoniae]|nr:DUF3310 domain-containing protein [Streptococcus pneumoniae]
MKPEQIDNVNKPSHYQGRYGMESIDALRNFMPPEQLKGFFLGNSLKYLLRHQKKSRRLPPDRLSRSGLQYSLDDLARTALSKIQQRDEFPDRLLQPCFLPPTKNVTLLIIFLFLSCCTFPD